MAKVINLQKVLRTLDKFKAKHGIQNTASVVVGYTASYALYVHENLQARHGEAFNAAAGERKRDVKGRFKKGQGRRGPGQQAKFLERPAREKQGEIAAKILAAMRRRTPLLLALKVGGLFLQRESQKIVPVDTGNLKASAFTEIE